MKIDTAGRRWARTLTEPDMAQASERALRSLKMQENHHINKFMIKFAEHTAFTGWNDIALYGKFYRGLAE